MAFGAFLSRSLAAGAGVLVLLAGCGAPAAEEEASDAFTYEPQGEDGGRITVEPDAVETLHIETGTVSKATGDLVAVPYGALLYAPDGSAFVYTNPEEDTYDRHPVTVDHIAGDQAFVTDGPAPDTAVVTQGAAELTGMEFGLEDE